MAKKLLALLKLNEGETAEHFAQRFMDSISLPVECHLFKKDSITKEDFDFEKVKEYFDYSHEWRYLYRCRQCGHYYVYDSIEFVDWEHGNDEIYSTLIPISKLDADTIDFGKMHRSEVLKITPVILWWPLGGVKWFDKVV